MMMMKHYFLVVTLLSMAVLHLAINVAPTTGLVVEEEQQQHEHVSRFLVGQNAVEEDEKISLASSRGRKCNKFPTICYLRGSPGPHCCNTKCVDVGKDRANCGKCGRRCKYGDICCGGKCVNPSFNSSHCGGCGNKCQIPAGRFRKRPFCAFGLCNYA